LGQNFGAAVPAGIVSTTGIAGLTLGGGTGYLTRKYGLTIDNLIGVDMVLADGSFVTANTQEYPDLFWAVRGGGGNFGIVTSFLYRACPIRDVVGGPMFWDLRDAREILEWHAEFMPYTAMQSLFDALVPSGLQWYWKGHFVDRPSKEAVDRHLEFGSQVPTLLSTMHLYPIDGAAARVGRSETAFS
jgi:FAD/FMN-containing dehydrogenase